MMKNKRIVGMFIAVALTGCAAINAKDDDCPLSKGIACQSMKTVDELASQGYFTEKKPSTHQDHIPNHVVKINITLERGRDNDSQ